MTIAVCVGGRAQAGSVLTAAGRREGTARLHADCIEVAGTKVPWGQIAALELNEQVRSPGGPNVLRLKSGEVWHAEVLSLTTGRLKLRMDPFGVRQIDVAAAAAIEFSAGLRAPADLRPQTLYRAGQQPVPGALLWIDEARLAMDSPFGAITLSRKGTLRYVFAAPPARAALREGDEVVLVNGTVLRGRVRGTEAGVKLAHAALGELSVPAAALRAVVRSAPAARFLTELPLASASTASAVGAGETKPAVAYLAATPGRARKLRFVRALRVEPRTVLRYSLRSRPAGSERQLRMRLAPAAGARGEVRVTIAVDGQAAWRGTLAPGTEPVAVAARLPNGKALSIDVDFGERLGWPAAAVLADPLVVSVPGGRPSPAAAPPAARD